MKKLFSLFVALIATTSLWAQTFQVGDLYYNTTSSSEPYTVEVSDAVSSITSAIIPETVTYNGTTFSVTRIGGYAFSNCTSLASINIGSRVTHIGYCAFMNCTNLTSLFLPQSVAHLDVIEGFSHGSVNLTSIDVADNNATYCSIDGVVFSKDQKKLILYPSGRKGSYTTPMSTTIIGCGSFHGSPLSSIVMTENVKEIEIWAFEECSSLKSVSIPSSVTTIGRAAFAGCTRLYDIYTYATYPPFAEESSFANYNVYVYVPCDSKRDYTRDPVWGKFKFIECLESEETTTDGNVTVVPGTNDVTITWPTEGNADTYTVVIKKGNEVFCTLTFNAEGQLLNIAFAPSRDGNHPAQYAEQAGKGYRFTVTGLNEGTHYTYNIDVKDASNKTIKSHSGEFTTQSTTAVDNITTNNANIQKIMRDGQLIILRDGVEYNAIGAQIQ